MQICCSVMIGTNGINHAFAALCKTFSEDWSNDAENPVLIIVLKYTVIICQTTFMNHNAA